MTATWLERRRSRVVRAAWLWCRKSPEGREFKAGLCHPTTGKQSLLNQQKMGTFFELGNDAAAKAEGLAPSFICCAIDIVGQKSPLPLRL